MGAKLSIKGCTVRSDSSPTPSATRLAATCPRIQPRGHAGTFSPNPSHPRASHSHVQVHASVHRLSCIWAQIREGPKYRGEGNHCYSDSRGSPRLDTNLGVLTPRGQWVGGTVFRTLLGSPRTPGRGSMAHPESLDDLPTRAALSARERVIIARGLPRAGHVGQEGSNGTLSPRRLLKPLPFLIPPSVSNTLPR